MEESSRKLPQTGKEVANSSLAGLGESMARCESAIAVS
jgi:hypothetical protein